MKIYTSQTTVIVKSVDSKKEPQVIQATKNEIHFDNGSVIEKVTANNTKECVKVTVLHVSCKKERDVIKSLYAQEYQEYERVFLN